MNEEVIRKDKWTLTEYLPHQYVAELRGVGSVYVKSAHCKACAIVGLILKHGGDADLRGLSSYGICYQHLVVTVRAAREPEADNG